MDEEVSALANRVHDLIALIRSLRDENQRLRTQLADADADLSTMRQRVESATRRIDHLVSSLPVAGGADAAQPPAA
jgi:chromosome segregation ATPase